MIARRQVPVPENLDVLLVEQEVGSALCSCTTDSYATDV